MKRKRFEGCPYTETSAGIPLKSAYTPEDIKEIDHSREISDPGEYPFTRGIWKDMYRGKLWTRRVFSGIGSAADTNRRYKNLIEKGATGLYLFPDQPSMLGIDPDHPIAEGYAGVSGCACDMDFLEEIAKFRAARYVWAKLTREKYNARDVKSCRLYISTHTAGSSLTALQPVNNIIRITLQSLACVLGGLQSFDPAGYDEAYCTLSKDAELTSMNIHNILAYESRVASVADPLGGAYFVEWLTKKMEDEMIKIIKK